MKKNLLLSGLSALCILYSFQINSFADNTKLYRSSSVYDFNIEYPSNWDVKEGGNVIAFVSPIEDVSDKFRENVNFFIEDLGKSPMTIDEYVKLTEANGPKLIKEFKMIDKGPSVIANEKAQMSIYEGQVKGNALKFRAYTFIRNNKAYTLTYTALPTTYNQYLADAEKIMQSLNLK